jgi:hypothetical protein
MLSGGEERLSDFAVAIVKTLMNRYPSGTTSKTINLT